MVHIAAIAPCFQHDAVLCGGVLHRESRVTFWGEFAPALIASAMRSSQQTLSGFFVHLSRPLVVETHYKLAFSNGDRLGYIWSIVSAIGEFAPRVAKEFRNLTATLSTIERTTISNRRLAIQSFSRSVVVKWAHGFLHG